MSLKRCLIVATVVACAQLCAIFLCCENGFWLFSDYFVRGRDLRTVSQSQCLSLSPSDCLWVPLIVSQSYSDCLSVPATVSQPKWLSFCDWLDCRIRSQWLSLVTVSGSQFQWLSLSPSDSHSQWLSLSSIKCISTHWMSLSLSYCLTVFHVFSLHDCLLVTWIVSHSQWLFLFDGISVLVYIFQSQWLSLITSDCFSLTVFLF